MSRVHLRQSEVPASPDAQRRLRALQSGDSDTESSLSGDDDSGLTCQQRVSGTRYRMSTYIGFTWRSVKKRPCGCCLGIASCFLVVFCVAVLVSLMNNVPAVFLRLAEAEVGETDLRVSPIIVNGGRTMDWSIVDATLRDKAESHPAAHFSYNSPRNRITGDNVAYSFSDCEQTLKVFAARWSDRDTEGRLNTGWAYMGPSGRDPWECGMSPTTMTQVGCLESFCTKGSFATYELVTIDSAKEDHMGLGRTWRDVAPPGPIPEGSAVLSMTVARKMRVQAGDTVILHMRLSPHLIEPFQANGYYMEDPWEVEMNRGTETVDTRFFTFVNLGVKVHAIVENSAGKLPNDAEDFVLMEYSTFLKDVARDLHPAAPPGLRDALRAWDPYKTANEIHFNFPPDIRFSFYDSADYDKVQKNVLEFAGEVVYRLGYTRFVADVPLLDWWKDSRFFMLFLGLIISIIVTILTLLSIILIYSLLMINVETRTFELGVLRMVGLNRSNLIQLILVQAFIYAVPAWILGLILGQVAYLGLAKGLEQALLVELPTPLTGGAIFLGTVLGLAIPILSALIPIRNALTMNLQDSLDTRHSKTKAVEFKIERAGVSKIPWILVLTGGFLALFGFLIYYLFPLAMLTFNVLLLLYILFGLLLSMLLGLILLALNLENMVETGLTWGFLWWENAAIRSLVLKNLVAHRKRNRKTAIMYSLSLAFIIWIAVSFELQIVTFQYRVMRRYGTKLSITENGEKIDWLTAVTLETLALRHPLVEDFTWMTPRVADNNIESSKISTLGRYRRAKLRIHGMSPNFYEVTDDSFLKVKMSRENKDSISAQLYSATGSHQLPLGSVYRDYLNLPDLERRFSLVIVEKNNQTGTDDNTQGQVGALAPVFQSPTHDIIEVMTPLAFLDASPVLTVSKFPRFINQWAGCSVPTYLRLKQHNISGIRAMKWDRILLRTKDPLSKDEKNRLIADVQSALSAMGARVDGYNYNDLEARIEPISSAAERIRLFFAATTVIAMVMCFFSLISSMVTNIFEQSKEIGVLRALGIRKAPLVRAYIYEAFILVLSASLMGFLIGTSIAWTMGVQRVLFTQLPLPFRFPKELFFTVLIMAVLTAICAAFFPTMNLLKKPIVYILRRLLT